MKPIMIQGTSSGAGKTTMVAALCRIFADKGVSVAPFKSQNMSSFTIDVGVEISRAQAIQGIAARCKITPDLNPVLLKPQGDNTSMVYIDGKPHKVMDAKEYYAFAPQAARHAAGAFSRLQKDYDLVILEGAGSPAEINLKHDIANMEMAEIAGASVLLVSDIDRGGSFASLAGTAMLLKEEHRDLIKGFVFNKFRGDMSILEPGFPRLEGITGIPVIGTIPMMTLDIPDEDSLGCTPSEFAWNRQNIAGVEQEISRLARMVKSSIDMELVERMAHGA